MEPKVDALPSPADQKLQQEFNQWAVAGRGDEMEDHHSDITNQALELMGIGPNDRILDLGCGTGWASRRMARSAAEVVGLDVADEMLHRARETSAGFKNVSYVWGSAEEIPAPDGYFTKVLSVESFYYYADQGKALDELRRVLQPGGQLYILINLYKDNHYSLRWVSELKVPVQALSEKEYIALLENHGFNDVQARRIPTAALHRRLTPESGSRTQKNCGILRGSARYC